MYTDANLEPPFFLESREVKKFFQGVRREEQKDRNEGRRAKTPGKMPMSFTVFRILCQCILESDYTQHRDRFFVHCFLVLSWNLMCRGDNTAKIVVANIGWREDALTVTFYQSKSRQDGDRPVDPKHVYANPMMPEVCPVLALAMYLATHENEDGKLFSGESQLSRYSQALNAVKYHYSVVRKLAEFGQRPEDIGCHSTRKGVATYVSSGTTDGPAQAAIENRVDWASGVQKTYQRYAKAGDQYVGRVASGLPVNSPEFARMAPHFYHWTSEIDVAVRSVFPSWSECDGVKSALPYLLASLCYHESWLREKLSPDSRIFKTSLFTCGFAQQLKSRVVSKTVNDDRMTATGIPGMVKILNAISTVQGAVEQFSSSGCGGGVSGELTELKQMLCRLTEKFENGLRRIESSEDNSVHTSAEGRQIFFWGDKARLVPENFKFPVVTLRQGLHLWLQGENFLFGQHIYPGT